MSKGRRPLFKNRPVIQTQHPTTSSDASAAEDRKCWTFGLVDQTEHIRGVRVGQPISGVAIGSRIAITSSDLTLGFAPQDTANAIFAKISAMNRIVGSVIEAPAESVKDGFWINACLE